MTVEVSERLRDLVNNFGEAAQGSGMVGQAHRELLSAILSLEEDGRRLDWLGAQLNCVVTMPQDGRMVDHYLHGTDITIREAIDAAAAIPTEKAG